MTTMEMNANQFSTARTDWLDSVSEGIEDRKKVFAGFRTWVTGLVYGVDGPTKATFTRFVNQSSQVPTFIDTHSFSIGENIVLGEE
jgi:hypothetical protein